EDRPLTELPPPAASHPITLTDALRRRRSIRTYAARPLRLEELSTLLYHSARVVGVMSDPQLGDRMLRPFPTAGARSELEIYAVTGDVSGLEPGAHYYDASGHRLFRVRNRDEHQKRILRSVEGATG